MIRLLDLLKEDIIEKRGSIPTLVDSLPLIKEFGDKTILTREFRGIKTGAALVSSGPITKGRVGMVLDPTSITYNKGFAEILNKVVEKYDLKHIVYCSHGNVRFFLGGGQYYMVPKGPYKLLWSPKVRDIYADVLSLERNNKLLTEFPIDSYVTTWPTGNVDEVLVDCEEYYLITTRIPIIKSYMQRKQIKDPTTYSELYSLIENSIKPYI